MPVKCSRCHNIEAAVLLVELEDSEPDEEWGTKIGQSKPYCIACLQNDYG